MLDLGWFPQGAGETGQLIAYLHRAQVHGGLTHLLKYQRDGALVPIIIGDGQGNPFSLFHNADDDELARLGLARHFGCGDHHQLGDWR